MPNEQATGTIEEIGQRDHSVTSEYRLFGPPGTGKTTNLSRQIRRAVDRYGPGSVLVTSFSRTAAAELAGRDLPIDPDRIGTLHSHCYHALGAPVIAESCVEEWNRENPRLALTPARNQSKLDGEEAAADDGTELAKDGDEILQQLSRFRGLMIPQKGWSLVLRQFEEKWTRYKQNLGLVDFTDLIERCLHDIAIAPRAPSVIFADEAQDLNRMQLTLIRKWGERANYFILGGDDDQASLPGSMVMTEGGESIPVETLNPARHPLVSYDGVHSQLNGFRKGHAFRVEPSPYCGHAVRVQVADRVTSTTHNHPWLFRWTPASRDKHIVYLMRKGESFRVGWCKLIRADGTCHLRIRAHLEHADAAWILRLCDSRSEASLWESFVAAEYGICTAVWRPMHDQCGGHYTPEVISQLFDMLGDHAGRGARCLRAFGRDLNLPFYERGNSNRFGALTIKTAGCNLIPTIMAVPVVERLCRDGVSWRPIDRIERFLYDGCVYGLSVPPHHTYVADGIATHNCIFSFTGASPDAILDPDIPDDHKIILKQSFRVPRAVHDVADKLIRQVTRRQEKIYLPRPEEGAVQRLSSGTYKSPEYFILKSVEEQLRMGKSVMFLAACSYMLQPVVAALRKRGVPFHNPYRMSNGFWNPLRIGKRGSSASRILALLVAHPDFGERHRPWTHGDVALWAENLAAKGILKHGMKKNLQRYDPAQTATIERLDEIFETGALTSLMDAWDGDYRALLNWWCRLMTADTRGRVQFPVDVAVAHGPRALMEPPQVVVGTIHSVKGGQADCVYLFPDISQAGDAQYNRGGVARDSVIRVFYVGLTRARETLYICQRETGMAVTI